MKLLQNGSEKYQFLCALGANLMFVSQGLIFAASGYLIPELEDEFGINTYQGSWVASIMVLGCLLGSLMGGFQCHKVGRKISIMIDCLVFVLATIFFICACNFEMILVARFVQGHAASSSAVSIPLYTSETSQPQVRKITGVLAVICYCCGSALSSILGASCHWRLAIGLFLLAPFGSLAILSQSPKSPTWLLSKGHEEEAVSALTSLRADKSTIQTEKDLIKASFQRNSNTSQPFSVGNQLKNGLEMMKNASFYKPFGLLLILFPIGMSWSGLITIGFYMVPILKDANIAMDPYWAGALVQVIRAFASIFGLFLNKKFKRRPVYLACCLFSCLGTLTLATYYKFNSSGTDIPSFIRWIPIICVVLVYVSYGLGLGSIPIMLQVRLDQKSFWNLI